MRKRLVFFGVFLLLFYTGLFSYSNKAEEKVKEGILSLKGGQLDTAISLFKEASKLDTIYPEPFYWLGKTYLKQENLEEAEKYAKKAFSLNRHEPKYKNLLSEIDYARALRLEKNGDTEGSYQKVKAILDDNPYFLSGYEFLIKYFLRKGDYKKAQEVVRKVENFAYSGKVKDSDPEYLNIIAYKAIISFRSKDYARAMVEIKKLLRYKDVAPKIGKYYELIFSDKNPYYTNLKKGEELFNQKKYLEAKKYLLAAEKYDVTGKAKQLLQKIDSYEQAKKLLEEARNDYEKGKYQDAMSKLDKANSLYYMEESQQLLKNIQKKLSQSNFSSSSNSYQNVDPKELRKRKGKELQKHYKKAIEFFKNKEYLQAETEIKKAIVLAEELKLKPAVFQKIRAVEKKIKQASNKISGAKKKLLNGVGAFKKKDWRGVISNLSEIENDETIKMEMYYSKIPYFLACAYFETHNLEKAYEYAQKVLLVDSKNVDIHAICAFYIFKRFGPKDPSFNKYWDMLSKNSKKTPLAQKVFSQIRSELEKLKKEEESQAKKKKIIIAVSVVVLFIIIFFVKNIISDMLNKKRMQEASKDKELESFVSQAKGKGLDKESVMKLKKAKELLDRAMYEKSYKLAKEVLEKYPEEKKALLIAGMCLLKMEKFDGESLPIFEKLSPYYPDNMEILRGLIECYLFANKYTPTLFKSIKKYLEKNPDNQKYKEILEEKGR